MEAIKLASGAITAMPLTNVDLLMWKPLIFSVTAYIKNLEYMKPNPAVGRLGYRWKTADI
jgi:hypothetical protein